MSKYEEKIEKILKAARLDFEREKTFGDLKKGRFRFDFWIKLSSGRHVIVEVNGEQHYEYVSFFYKNKREWMKMQEHDRRKISYCLGHDIDIYIIPYWDMDQIANVKDIFRPQYKARSRWHNDDVWNKRKDRH